MTVYGILSRTPTRLARGGEARFGDHPFGAAVPHRFACLTLEDRASTLYDDIIIYNVSFFVNRFC